VQTNETGARQVLQLFSSCSRTSRQRWSADKGGGALWFECGNQTESLEAARAPYSVPGRGGQCQGRCPRACVAVFGPSASENEDE